MIYVLAILCPPLALFIRGKFGNLLINLVLCLLGYVPAMIHACLVILDDNAKKRDKELFNKINN